ncbi:type II toxin-antitoxin system RelE/ParE family toxin [Pseudomonas aeruginosa]|nr:type II toxin-antitoxin system RelE/ParE family toxin [Pseudomonas aeruginosa]
MEYSLGLYFVAWDIEYTDEFGDWWGSLSEDEQESLAVTVRLLEERGAILGAPPQQRHQWLPPWPYERATDSTRRATFRTLYAFDPRRSAILLIGGDKTGDDRWYELNVPIADRLYDEHLHQLREEGLIDG